MPAQVVASRGSRLASPYKQEVDRQGKPQIYFQGTCIKCGFMSSWRTSTTVVARTANSKNNSDASIDATTMKWQKRNEKSGMSTKIKKE
jgi:hypothetical protein